MFTVIAPLVNAQDTAACAGPFTNGVSNSFVGSEWRTQMTQNFEDTVAEFNAAGTQLNLLVESADTDVPGQQQQIQNLVNAGVNAIIIDTGDQSGLNLDLEDAVSQGIVVIAIDQEIGAQGVYNVVIDQTEWARISARWLVHELGGAGDIVSMERLSVIRPTKPVCRALWKCLTSIPTFISLVVRAVVEIRRLDSRS